PLTEERLVAHRLGQVEDDPVQVGAELQQLGEERAVPAADVDDRLAVAPLDGLEALDPCIRSLRHRPVEPRAVLRVLGEPRPEVGAEDVGEDGVSARVESLDSAVPDAAEEDGEIVPAAREQKRRCRCVAEDASFLLRKDAVAGERAEEAVECVLVGAGIACQLCHRPWSARKSLGNPELGDDSERAGCESPPQDVPDRFLRGDVAHPRAAATAAATSSTSSSVIVRQSSRHRPSRTTPITGGSAPRSLGASSSSTAQAKLGSSVSGRAPPPTRPTVASTSPPTSPASRCARARTFSTGSASIRRTGTSRTASSG